ncbi:hypothetical protein GQ42DRAFT_153025 [Ramicandelaber brevisporus]|nr:hypothetical protein GQ42DRAFT_153025 [Ramicandelaber brevisporus]
MEHAKYRQQQQKMAQRSRLYGSNADDGIDDDDDGNGRGIGSVRKPTDMAASWAPDVGRSTKRLRQHVSQASPQIGVDIDDRQRAIIENSRAVPSPAPPPPIPLPGDEESDEEGNDGNAMDVDDPLVNL